jgi:hypothetical protein
MASAIQNLHGARAALVTSRRDIAAKMNGSGYSVPVADLAARLLALQNAIGAIDLAMLDEAVLADAVMTAAA